MKAMKWIFVFVICLFSVSCEKSSQPKIWKYGDGAWAGDVLETPSFDIKNDTIFREGKPYFKIIKIEKRGLNFFASDKLHIQNLSTGEEGVYVRKK